MPIEKLKLKNVGPFDDIELEFDPQVNVFTGPNNSGKSSALWALSGVTVYPFMFPQKLLRDGKDAKFKLQLRGGTLFDTTNLVSTLASSEHIRILKQIGYSKFIPALRRSTDFRSPGPTVARRKEEGDQTRSIRHYLENRESLISLLSSSRDSSRTSEESEHLRLRERISFQSRDASVVIDERVIQRIIDLDYRSYIRKSPQSSDIIITIGEIASEITEGFPLRFSGVNEDERGFFPEFTTIDGPMPLNTLSQGTQSIIQWLAHLLIGYAEYYDFPDDLSDKPGVVIIDEIDAHLHPSWQRRIIPTLTERFPNLQIFCSTHSPLMLAGLKSGQVQLLRRDEEGHVTVSRNDDDIIGWSADEVMRYILDMPNTTDLQTEERLNRLQELRRKDDRSPAEESEFQDLRRAINQDLTSGPTAAQIERFADGMRKALAKNQEVGAAIADAAESSYRGD